MAFTFEGKLEIPLEEFYPWATDNYYWVRLDVASNLNTSPKTLEQLATDLDPDVLYFVSRNPNTPHYIKKYIKIQDHLARL